MTVSGAGAALNRLDRSQSKSGHNPGYLSFLIAAYLSWLLPRRRFAPIRFAPTASSSIQSVWS